MLFSCSVLYRVTISEHLFGQFRITHSRKLRGHKKRAGTVCQERSCNEDLSQTFPRFNLGGPAATYNRLRRGSLCGERKGWCRARRRARPCATHPFMEEYFNEAERLANRYEGTGAKAIQQEEGKVGRAWLVWSDSTQAAPLW